MHLRQTQISLDFETEYRPTSDIAGLDPNHRSKEITPIKQGIPVPHKT